MSGMNWFLLTVDSKRWVLKYISYVVNTHSMSRVDLLMKERILLHFSPVKDGKRKS
jgi:hypothetical protein